MSHPKPRSTTTLLTQPVPSPPCLCVAQDWVHRQDPYHQEDAPGANPVGRQDTGDSWGAMQIVGGQHNLPLHVGDLKGVREGHSRWMARATEHHRVGGATRGASCERRSPVWTEDIRMAACECDAHAPDAHWAQEGCYRPSDRALQIRPYA